MTGVMLLQASDCAAMAALHASAFPQDEAWSLSAFKTLLVLPSVRAFGIGDAAGLDALCIVQVAAGDGEILTLATAPSVRRKGYASALLKAAGQILGQLGTGRFLLEVAADNHVARAFYLTLGFKTDGRRKNYYKRLDGVRIDAILLSRSIAGQTDP